MARCAAGSGTAVAAALSALGEQPPDGRIYGAPARAQQSGKSHASQQLQHLAASLPQLELSYRSEDDEELLLSGSDAASVAAQSHQPQQGTPVATHTDRARTTAASTAPSQLHAATSSSAECSAAAQNDNQRGWGWSGADQATAPGLQQGAVQGHAPRSGAQRSNPKPKRDRKPRQKHKRRHHALRKSDMLPTIEAVAAIVLGSMIANESTVAEQLYGQVRRQGSVALSGLLQRGSRVFELLMEGYCRSGRVHEALEVFDDWKAARDLVLQQHLYNSKAGNGGSGEAPEGANSVSTSGFADSA